MFVEFGKRCLWVDLPADESMRRHQISQGCLVGEWDNKLNLN